MAPILAAGFPFGRMSGMDKLNDPATTRTRGCVRLLFWGAVVSSLFAAAVPTARGNTRGMTIGAILVVISVLMALYIEWKSPSK